MSYSKWTPKSNTLNNTDTMLTVSEIRDKHNDSFYNRVLSHPAGKRAEMVLPQGIEPPTMDKKYNLSEVLTHHLPNADQTSDLGNETFMDVNALNNIMDKKSTRVPRSLRNYKEDDAKLLLHRLEVGGGNIAPAKRIEMMNSRRL